MATPSDVQWQNTSRGEAVERVALRGVWGLFETLWNLDKGRMKEDGEKEREQKRGTGRKSKQIMIAGREVSEGMIDMEREAWTDLSSHLLFIILSLPICTETLIC